MDSHIEPIGANVVIRAITKEAIKGISRVETGGRERPHKGVVVAIGDGRHVADDGTVTKLEPPFAVGDTVYFGKFDTDEIWLDGQRMFVLPFFKIRAKEKTQN